MVLIEKPYIIEFSANNATVCTECRGIFYFILYRTLIKVIKGCPIELKDEALTAMNDRFRESKRLNSTS